MKNDLGEIFLLALNYFYKKYKAKGGTQNKLADRLGITQSYISAVLNGSKTASLELQNELANILYGPYEEFLLIGRRIRNGLDPKLGIQGEDEGVESLIAKFSHYVIDHQRIEKELVQSREKLRDIILTSNDMIIEMDRDMRFTSLDGNVEEVTGMSEVEMLGQNFFEYLDENERARIQALTEVSIRDHSIMECTLFLTVNNERNYRQLTAKPFYDDRGQFAGFKGTCKNITKQVQSQEELEHNSWLISTVMESTEWVGLLIMNEKNKIIKYNSVYKKIFEIPDEILQENNPRKTYAWVKTRMRDPDNFMKTTLEVLSKAEKFTHEYDLVDGRRIRRVALPLFRDGELAGRHVLFYDITQT
ncbi:MAG: PAS domain S-box protein [Thermodesulfobacteriota bacterium]